MQQIRYLVSAAAMLVQVASSCHVVGGEGTVFSYADLSISRRLELRPRSREITEAEAAANHLLAELRRAKARIVADEKNTVVAIQLIEIDTEVFSDEALRDFRKLTSLCSLWVRAPRLIHQLLPEFSSLPKLQELSLSTWSLSSAAIDHLGKVPALTRLSLEDTRIDGVTAKALASLPNLHELHFDQCSYPGGIETALVPMPRLRSFWITGGLLGGPHSLKGLESLSGLQCLWISSIWCSQEAMQRIGRLSQLEELSLQFTGLNDDMLRELGTLARMRRAILGNTTDFTGEGLGYLGAWRELEELSVFSTSFEDGAVNKLLQFPALGKFYADRTFLTDSSIDELVKLRKLKSIQVSNTKITPAGIERMKKALPECEVR